VRRTRVQVGLGVIVGTLVFVVDEETDGCTEGYIVLSSRLEVDLIELGALDEVRPSDIHSRGSY